MRQSLLKGLTAIAHPSCFMGNVSVAMEPALITGEDRQRYNVQNAECLFLHSNTKISHAIKCFIVLQTSTLIFISICIFALNFVQ